MTERQSERSREAERPGAAGPGSAAARAESILAMQRLAAGPDGTAALLTWMARRCGRWVALLDAHGAVLRAAAGQEPSPDRSAPELAAEGVAVMAAQGARSARVDRDGRTGWFVTTGTGTAGPVLAVVGPGPGPADLPRLLADAARVAGLCWRIEEADRQRRRSEEADARSREAVLHLLMVGDLPLAHRIASALGPTLPDPVRVCVVEGPAERRAEIAADLRRTAADRTWIVPCPVYVRHLIVIAPAAPAASAASGHAADPLGGAEVWRDGCALGVSTTLPLRETALGYAEAFNALAVARSAPGRQAVFGTCGDPAPLLGPDGAAWARLLLRPLTEHAPARRLDPGAPELLATLTSWLNFGSAATRHLKVHRNTLAARLRLIEDLLRLDLDRLPGQATASLALRLRGLPAPPPASGPPSDLDALLATPAAARWADALLRPLTASGPPSALATVRTWLAHDARLAPSAAALGITAPAVRKRLARVEGLLRRSLLEAPSAKYDLWLADRAVTLTERRETAALDGCAE